MEQWIKDRAFRKSRLMDMAASAHRQGDHLALQMYLDQMNKIDEELAGYERAKRVSQGENLGSAPSS